MVGIVEEQHPERARLFMQWKEMSWPVLADPLDLLDVSYVPITLAIDEHGIIRAIQPKADEIEESFVNRSYAAPGDLADEPAGPDMGQLEADARGGSTEAMGEFADALVLWGGEHGLDEAIGFYEKALRFQPQEGKIHFRLGVAQRARYDSSVRASGDFSASVESWSAALEMDPNNYIWRRRIQQYGPRLGKPYPFYDWVTKAREEIAERGETPVALAVEPGGAEIAHPSPGLEESKSSESERDPEGRVERDGPGFIHIEPVAVPNRISPGQAVRVHVVFHPNEGLDAHWNNEGGSLALWVEPPEGWTVSSRYHEIHGPPDPVSKERRTVEFELLSPPQAEPGTYPVTGYALYYVCEGAHGVCLYRRQDLTMDVEVR